MNNTQESVNKKVEIENMCSTKTIETIETIENNDISKDIICPYCDKYQLKIITVSICEAKHAVWYKCSEPNSKCPLFQNK